MCNIMKICIVGIFVGLAPPVRPLGSYMGLIQIYYQITCQPVNQAICIFIIVAINLYCNLVSIKCIMYYV